MRVKPKRLVKPIVTQQQAEQMVKVMAVLLRDRTPMSFQEVVSLLISCWNHTESEQESINRERRHD